MKKVNIRTIDELKKFLRKFFKGKDIKLYLFGSRARSDNSKFSDIDIGFISKEDISKEIVGLKKIIEESNFPYKFDIVDLSKNNQLLKIVMKEGKRWI